MEQFSDLGSGQALPPGLADGHQRKVLEMASAPVLGDGDAVLVGDAGEIVSDRHRDGWIRF